jgi:hypothetical protein
VPTSSTTTMPGRSGPTRRAARRGRRPTNGRHPATRMDGGSRRSDQKSNSPPAGPRCRGDGRYPGRPGGHHGGDRGPARTAAPWPLRIMARSLRRFQTADRAPRGERGQRLRSRLRDRAGPAHGVSGG